MNDVDSLESLILDYGGVLTWPQRPDSVERMARLADAPPERFLTAYRGFRGGYDAGTLTGAAYWREVLSSLGRPSQPPEDVLARLAELDTESWTHYREEMWELARAARAAGLRTAMLTNCPFEILARIRADRRPDRSFDAVVASCEIGSNKPDRHIYEACLARLGVEARRALFVDDSRENLDGAAALGFCTLHFFGDGATLTLKQRLAR
jgi:putative hydrolase of the HAD superfamily